ncbi:MAG TPA: hypothetical protein PL193_07615 [Xanthobacteraceae bacterium]|nr:hypothetical protein [Xanthobacteraceae bacterium]
MTAWRQAVHALHSALTVKSQESGSDICAPLLNELLPERLEAFGSDGLEMFLNVLNGAKSAEDSAEFIGAELPGAVDGFDIVWHARVELIVGGLDQPTRQAAFDLALDAIDAALALDRTLGGKVTHARILQPDMTDHAAAGMDNIDGADITVELQFTSSKPY